MGGRWVTEASETDREFRGIWKIERKLEKIRRRWLFGYVGLKRSEDGQIIKSC